MWCIHMCTVPTQVWQLSKIWAVPPEGLRLRWSETGAKTVNITHKTRFESSHRSGLETENDHIYHHTLQGYGLHTSHTSIYLDNRHDVRVCLPVSVGEPSGAYTCLTVCCTVLNQTAIRWYINSIQQTQHWDNAISHSKLTLLLTPMENLDYPCELHPLSLLEPRRALTKELRTPCIMTEWALTFSSLEFSAQVFNQVLTLLCT